MSETLVERLRDWIDANQADRLHIESLAELELFYKRDPHKATSLVKMFHELEEAERKLAQAQARCAEMEGLLLRWHEWFMSSGDGTMAGLNTQDYQEVLAQWIRDGHALAANALKEPR